jgi:hypothetical protein
MPGGQRPPFKPGIIDGLFFANRFNFIKIPTC